VSDPGLSVLPVPRLLVWRHGRTAWNAAGRFQGQLDPPLDAVGRAQATRAAPHLRAAGLSATDTVVVSSDLVRAAATAATLTDLLGIPLRTDRRLREHGMGCWEGLTRDAVAERYPDQYADWMAGRPVRGRGGEEPEHVGDRVLAALAELPPVAVAVVVTHGGTAGRLVERLLGLGSDHRRVIGPLANCAWSELVFQGTRWRLLRHNSAVLDGADGAPGGDEPLAGRRDRARDSNPASAGDADAVV
jgi:broad specificity phosphatase PhoE